MANILWLIVAVLVAIWLVGLVFNIVGGIIHILIVIAVAVAIYAFIKRKV
ncbi:MAG: lmo0937 family membrane protein [Acidobacteria bacterium]|nr:lmo0937 family membrane protein [Acidobacteriota bacterium]